MEIFENFFKTMFLLHVEATFKNIGEVGIEIKNGFKKSLMPPGGVKIMSY